MENGNVREHKNATWDPEQDYSKILSVSIPVGLADDVLVKPDIGPLLKSILWSIVISGKLKNFFVEKQILSENKAKMIMPGFMIC